MGIDRKSHVLILYDAQSTFTNMVYEHLDAFAQHSKNRIEYASIVASLPSAPSFDGFDVVLVHYSIKARLGGLPDPYRAGLAAFKGLKVLFVQDEYEWTESTRRLIEELGISTLFTCVPHADIETVYPKSRFPNLQVEHTLTGYVPQVGGLRQRVLPIAERRIVIGYRGRPLPFWYGELGQEKIRIGQRMMSVCRAKGILVDIAWTEADRIYGDAWLAFLASCKATLGTESGSNVFDEFGELRRAIENEVATKPSLAYEEVAERHLKYHEGRIHMNQVSPRIFEAAMMRTALVLFNGEYSGVVQPDRHFIPLRKDFSNVNEVLQRLADERGLQAMVDQTHAEIISSGDYSYRRFIDRFDTVVRESLGSGSRKTSGSSFDATTSGAQQLEPAPDASRLALTQRPLRAKQRWVHRTMNALWAITPQRVRCIVRPLARRLFWGLMRIERP